MISDWMSYIESLHPSVMDLSLDRVSIVASRLGLRLKSFVITVGGTNGKGSSVALLESILLKANYRVGAYFSPHLLVFNERIRIQGQLISDAKLTKAFKMVDIVREDTQLTFFEFTTLAALWLFQEACLDFVILEVGLGGRLDAVNIIDPDIAVITSISLDHIEYLGETRAAIAKEKAGILRPMIPVVCGDQDPPDTLLDACKKLACPCYIRGKDYEAVLSEDSWSFKGVKHYDKLFIPAIYLANAATVLQVLSLLPDKYSVTLDAIQKGLKDIQLQGRCQWLDNQWLVDVAHNPDSAHVLAKYVKKLDTFKKVHALIGMLKDKDQIATVTPLLSLVDHWWVASLPGERGCPGQVLADKLRSLSVKNIEVFSDLGSAHDALSEQLRENELVLVFGSFLTVGGIMKWRGHDAY